MKKLLMCFGLVLLFSTSAYADKMYIDESAKRTYRCVCEGMILSSRQLQYCGSGSLGGTKGDIDVRIPEKEVFIYLTPEIYSKLTKTRSVQFCKKTGWKCEPERRDK